MVTESTGLPRARSISFLRPAPRSLSLASRRAVHEAGIARRDQARAQRLADASSSARPVTFAQARGHGPDLAVADAAATVLDAGGSITRHGDHIVVNTPQVNANRGRQLNAAAHLYAAEAIVLAALGRGGKVGKLPDQHVTPNGALIPK